MIFLFLILLFGFIQANASEPQPYSNTLAQAAHAYACAKDSLTFSGCLRSVKKHKDVANKRLTVSFWQRNKNVKYSVTTDGEGRFSLPVADECRGSWTVYVSMPSASRGADYQIDVTSHGRKKQQENRCGGIYYDCDKGADSVLSNGLSMPTLYEWLLRQDPAFTKQNSGLSYPYAIEYPDHHFYIGRPRYEIYEHVNLPYEDVCCLTYEQRPVVWVYDNKFLRVSNIPVKVLGEWRKSEPRRTKANPEDQYRRLSTYSYACIVKDSDSWTQYLDLPSLKEYRPVTVFLYSRSVRMLKTGKQHIGTTYFDGYGS